MDVREIYLRLFVSPAIVSLSEWIFRIDIYKS